MDLPVRKKVGWGIKLSFRPIFVQLANWKRRRFELTQTQFLYAAEDGTLKGRIARANIVLAEPIENFILPHLKGNLVKHYPFAMRLYVGQQPFYFAVATEQARKSWISIFNNEFPLVMDRGMRVNSLGISPPLQQASSPPKRITVADPESIKLFKSFNEERLPRMDSFSMLQECIDLDDSDDCAVCFLDELGDDSVDTASISFLQQGSDRTGHDEVSVDMFLWNLIQQYSEKNGEARFTKEHDFSRCKSTGGWNECYQSTIEELFIPRTLGELQRRNEFSKKKLEVVEKLQDLELEFSNVASRLFAEWVETERFSSNGGNNQEAFGKNGIRFIMPKNIDGFILERFRKHALQSRQEAIKSSGSISQLYEMFLATAPDSHQREIATECMSIKLELDAMAEDPLGNHCESRKILQQKLKSKLNTPLFPEGSQMTRLPIYFPLYCIVDFLGFTAIAIADIGRCTPCLDGEAAEMVHDIADFVCNSLFHTDLSSLEKAGAPQLSISKNDSRCYLSTASRVAPAEDFNIWEMEADESFWSTRDNGNLCLRPELYHRFIKTSTRLSPTEFLHQIVIPEFATKINSSVISITSDSLCDHLHHAGINLRHIGRVYQLIHVECSAKSLFEQEIVARSLASRFLASCREFSSVQQCKDLWKSWEGLLAQSDCWSLVLDVKNAVSAKYWPGDMGIDYSSIDLLTVLLRIQPLVGMHEEGSGDEVGFSPVVHRIPVLSLAHIINPQYFYTAI